jgi:hypothetical protein
MIPQNPAGINSGKRHERASSKRGSRLLRPSALSRSQIIVGETQSAVAALKKIREARSETRAIATRDGGFNAHGSFSERLGQTDDHVLEL